MFVLANPKTPVKWPVVIKFPTDKGEVEKKFYASFYFKSDEELQELMLQGDIKFLKTVVAAFHELKDHLNKPIKGTPKDIELVCSNARVKRAIISAYYEFNHGDQKN